MVRLLCGLIEHKELSPSSWFSPSQSIDKCLEKRHENIIPDPCTIDGVNHKNLAERDGSGTAGAEMRRGCGTRKQVE